MSANNAIGKWFDYYRGVALSTFGVVVAFAFSSAPRGLQWLIETAGWSGAWQVLGALTLTVMTICGWLFFRDNPEECGLTMDGLKEDAPRLRKQHADAIAHRSYSRGEALRTFPFWAFNASFVFIAFFGTAFTFHVVSLGEEAGRTQSEVIGYFLPMAAVSVTTNLFCGWRSAHTRLKYLLALMNSGSLIGVTGLLNLHTAWGPWLHILGNGIAGGGFAALGGIVWPRFFGRRWLGAISGVAMASMVIGSGLGPLAFGLSYSFAESYRPVLLASALVPALLFISAWWADNPQRKCSP